MNGPSITERTLAVPGPSEHADTESSANLSLADWPDLGRRIKLTLAAFATPSNNVEVSVGLDKNGNGDLELEERHLVVGVDCGVWFAWERESPDEVKVEDAGQQWNLSGLRLLKNVVTAEPPTDTNLCARLFSIRQPHDRAKRFDFAKVTVRGRGMRAAEIAAEISRPGISLFLR